VPVGILALQIEELLGHALGIVMFYKEGGERIREELTIVSE
jgi:hypothetical protein